MADKPILFSAPMVRALLDGQKTQTRRIAKFVEPQGDKWHLRNEYGGFAGCTDEDVIIDGQFYAPIQRGDSLWVREAFSYSWSVKDDPDRRHLMPMWFWADGNPSDGDWSKPKPSIHMPRWASRLTLTVTDVRVQRLQEISRGDAMDEGCPFANMQAGPNPRDWYAELWNTINGAGAWEANPWVVAYTFDVHNGNIDAAPG